VEHALPIYDYDCEFAKTSPTIDLISIGIVADDGREYYAINAECDRATLLENPWLMGNVVPTLPLTRYAGTHGDFLTWDPFKPDYIKVKPREQIAREVAAFVLGTDHETSNQVPHVELWADYGAYDHVALCQLFGTMMDLPEGFPMWTHDLQQELERLGLTDDDLPKQDSGQHNALADARHNQRVRQYLAQYA
jgi:hypothetical protein